MSAPVLTRPAIPTVAWCVVGLYAGIVMAERLSWAHALDGDAPGPLVTAMVALAAAFVGALGILSGARRERRRAERRGCDARSALSMRFGAATLVVTVGVCVLLGTGIGSLRWHGWHAARAELEAGHAGGRSRDSEATAAVVVRDPVAGRFGWSAIVRPIDAAGVRARVMLPHEESPPRLGEILMLRGPIGAVPVEEEWSRRAHQRVEAGSVRLREVEVAGWARSPAGRTGPLRALVGERIDRVPGVGGDLLKGILLGDRTRLRGTQAEEDMRVCGLSHLMAVSGTHLGIVALLAAQLVTRAGRGVRTRVGFVALATLVYVLLTGVQPSSLRALGMGSVAGFAALSGRRGDGVAGLAVAAGGMLVADPAVAFDIGFRLSVCAVAGLVVFAPLACGWARQALGDGRIGRRLRPVADMLALTLVAQAATAPVAIPAFGMFSLIAPVANVVALPLLTVALLAGLCAAIAGLVVEPLAISLLSLAALPVRLIAAVASRLALVPGAAVGVDLDPRAAGIGVGLLATTLWCCWPMPRGSRLPRVIAAVLLAVTLAVMGGVGPSSSPPLLTVLDVGQGDAVLVRDGGRVMLVDTGPEAATLRSALTRAGVRRIDALVLTHDHADHTGGVSGIVGVARVAQAFGPVVADEDAFSHLAPVLERVVIQPPPDGCALISLRAGDVLTVGTARLEVLWPRAPDPMLSTNDTSVVLHLRVPGFSAILAGDAEDAVWNALGREGAIPDVDVVLVPHHGSSNGLTAEALEALSPSLALISAGHGNDFGHPSPGMLGMLADHGVRIARTDLHGDLRILVRPDGSYTVRFDRRGEAVPAYATIPQSIVSSREGPGAHVRIPARRPQARLSDTRSGRPAARTGRGPPQETARGGRRPRFQPRSVRR